MDGIEEILPYVKLKKRLRKHKSPRIYAHISREDLEVE